MQKDQPITSAQEYTAMFGRSLAKDAARVAIEARRFEIDLYWKRATYFWTLLAAVFVGYFVLQSSESESSPLASLVVSCIGLIFSLAWYLISRASAFWHANWDAHVHQIEDTFIGPLHKTKIDGSVFRLWHILLPYRTSGTKIHAATSFYVVLVWLFLAIRSLSICNGWEEPFSRFNLWVIGAITVVFVLILLFWTSPHKAKKVKTFVREARTFPDEVPRSGQDMNTNQRRPISQDIGETGDTPGHVDS